MIKITKVLKEDKKLKDFNLKAWEEVNLEHYGTKTNWYTKNFYFKAEEDNKIIGSINGKYESGVLYVGSLIVNKNDRKKGVGKKLIEMAEKTGRKFDIHKIYLITGKNWQSIKFYEAIGFKKEAEIPNHFFGKDFVAYSKFV